MRTRRTRSARQAKGVVSETAGSLPTIHNHRHPPALRRAAQRLPFLVGGRDPKTWFKIDQIDPLTFAIHEPHYWQRTVMYLLVGNKRALIFDTGSGLADLSAVTRELTSLPVTALASHMHWDHIGCHSRYARIAAPAIPELRHRTHGRWLVPARRSTLTPRARSLRVTEWIEPGSIIDLGGRELALLLTPGHTPDSISLHDRARKQLFVGDFVYDGPLTFGLLPGSDFSAARSSAHHLAALSDVNMVLPGHYGRLDPGRLPHLEQCLDQINDTSTGLSRVLPRRFDIQGFRVYLRGGSASAP